MYDIQKAVCVLTQNDPILGQLIQRAGPIDIDPPKRLNPFEALSRSIIYQQLSGKAASTIHGRVRKLFSGRSIKPDQMLALSDDTLRSAGMSGSKVKAAKDLAQKTIEGLIPSGARLRKMSDEEIIQRLTQVWGIGEWTVHMLLMFQLGRPDILPTKDLGVCKGFMLTYGLAQMPTETELTAYCKCWQPYRSVGSWYMWRAVDL